MTPSLEGAEWPNLWALTLPNYSDVTSSSLRLATWRRSWSILTRGLA